MSSPSTTSPSTSSRSIATSSAKRIIGVILLIAVVAVVALTVVAMSIAVTRVSTGADPSEALKEVVQIPDGLEERVNWKPDPELDRAVEPLTRTLIETTWVNAWARLSIAEATDNPAGLETWFLGDLKAITTALAPETPGVSTEQIDHLVEVTFYSVDGSIMTIDATSQFHRSIDGWHDVQTEEQFEAVLVLSDGNWRIIGLARTAVDVAQ